MSILRWAWTRAYNGFKLKKGKKHSCLFSRRKRRDEGTVVAAGPGTHSAHLYTSSSRAKAVDAASVEGKVSSKLV